MTGKPRSVRQAQALHAAQLRKQGRSWAEIGAVFCAVYRVNPRVALRQAHGWSQPQAAERWTALWPDDPKTFKNFSYWEQWPGQTGHAPSLDTLDRLARLYECKLTDLLTDCQDHGAQPARAVTALLQVRDRGRDQARDRRVDAAMVRRESAAPGLIPAAASSGLRAALETIRHAEIDELIQAGKEADEPGRRLRRRTLLLDASSALAVLAAAPVLEVPRLVAGSNDNRIRANPAVVSYTGDVVAGLRRLSGAVGPRMTLQPAIALRSAMAAMSRNVPEVVNSQALTAYGDLTQLIGWLMFNLGDHKAARYYYDDARAAAYRAGNYDLVAYTLATASHLAIAGRRPRYAVDHAQAAQVAAKASGSPHAIGYAADITARAYAAAGQAGRCQAALDKEREALTQVDDDAPRSPWWYFYDRSFYWGTESECALRLDMPALAGDAAHRSLGLPSQNLHASAMTLAFRAEALIRQGEIEQACDALAAAARLTTLNSSKRLAVRINVLRKQLRIADDTAAVRDLDEKLAEYRRARAASDPGGAAPPD